jgi:hypothetical protein
MIIWLASYPKSGNTWIRAFLISLISKNIKENSLQNMSMIRAYPVTNDFKNLLDDFKDFKKIAENWETSQNIINLSKKIRFLKTHNSLCYVNNFSFTNYKNSLGAIHVVRDPRNVITSLLNHYSLKNYESAIEFLFDEKLFAGKLDKKENYIRQTEFPILVSDWKNHYNSWKNFKKNYLLIRYEDLVHKPEKTFEKISHYISNLLKIKITRNKIKEAIKKNSFNNLQKIEEKFGFAESPLNEKSQKQKKFFNLGPKNDWKELLPDEIKKKIEIKFQKEMMELGYLNS